MTLPLVRNPTARDARIQDLRSALDDFYRTTRDYDAFVEPVDNSLYYDLMLPTLRRLLGERGRVRVLEFGCGRTTFPQFLSKAGLRDRVQVVVQDVTHQSEGYLRDIADEVVIGDISRVSGPVDLAFSTFVLEHVASPEEHLAAVARLLTPGGVHVIFCPNYELPGYLIPSLRHLPRARKLAATAFLALSRGAALLDRAPRFWVNVDPAVRHVPWYVDADAVYVASRRELARWHRRAGFRVERLRRPRPAGGLRELRGWWLREAITTMLVCTRLASS